MSQRKDWPLDVVVHYAKLQEQDGNAKTLDSKIQVQPVELRIYFENRCPEEGACRNGKKGDRPARGAGGVHAACSLQLSI